MSMEMVVKSMETAVEEMESMEMASGTLPRPGKVNIDFCSPKLVFDGDGAAELFWEKRRLI
jgi:hypothetical protein